MKFTELLLAQIEREARGTRESLERVPDGKGDWKPHPKSMPLGRLAVLLARMPSWTSMIIDGNELNLANTPVPEETRTSKELVEIHEQSLDAARKSLSNTTDEHLMKPWRLLFGDKVLDERPRHLVIADTIAHLAHHRGQLTVYLRLNDQPVPAIYGASADSGW
ncbi:MAG: damage-inducible protein DinB [Acidobacteria bacterium]|nr:MAG: damage-inducible protein DinB [Acidobacteriota bacterium]